tara:strand:- start:3 stop:299 length:297 start_codon:yes stop_codon:yes gene_type:complete
MTKMIIKKSTKPEKDYMAIFTERPNGRNKTVHFGDSKLPHYTSTATKEQRERYRKRHQKDLRTNDPERAGYLSYYILWGESKSIKKNIESYKRRFNLK